MGKGKLAKFAENLTFPNMFQPELDEDFRLKGKWRSDFFKNDHPIVLELGCGKGEYTVGLAQKYPNKNFIGVDIKGARIWRGCKTSNELKLSNVAFLRTRIQLIERFFEKNEVDEIWITFPDPQPKKENKRLTSPCLIAEYRKITKSNAIINLKSDDTDFYEYTVETAKTLGFPIQIQTADLYRPDAEHLEVMEIRTFYEQMWLDMGKKIKYVRYELCN